MPIYSVWQHFGRDIAPKATGVYELGDRDGAVVYIGRTGDLRERISAHAGSPPDTCVGKRAVYFRYERTLSGVTRERELFLEYKALHEGQIPPCNEQEPYAVSRTHPRPAASQEHL